ncbi:MAG TPA: TolC family protein [Gemmatimonadaceae bacterium]|jgi:outer membrane protein
MRSASLLALLALPAQLVLAQTPATSGGLTLDDAIRTAQQNNPAFQQIKNSQRNNDAQVRTARGALLPNLSASLGTTYQQGGTQYLGNGIPFTGSDSYSSNYSVNLGYNVTGGMFYAPKAAKAQRTAGEADITNQTEILRASITQQYITSAQSSALAAVMDTLVAVAQGQLDLANAKMEAGAGTIIDVRTAEVALGQARVNALTQHNDARLQKLRLFEQMGVPADADAPLTTTFSTTASVPALDSLLALAHRANPDLLAKQSRLTAAEAGVKLQRTTYLPSLQLSTGYGANAYGLSDAEQLALQKATSVSQSYSGCLLTDSLRIGAGLSAAGAPGHCGSGIATAAQLDAARANNHPWQFAKSPYAVGARISLPLFNGFQREANVEAARVQRDNAALDVRARNLQLTTNVTQAYLTLETQRQTVELLTQTAAKAAEDLALMQESFKVGARTFLDVTTARAAYEQAQINRVNGIYQFQSAFAALENAVGRPLR